MDRSEPGCYPESKAEKMCGSDGMSYATVRCDKTQMNRQKPGLSQTYGVHSDKSVNYVGLITEFDGRSVPGSPTDNTGEHITHNWSLVIRGKFMSTEQRSFVSHT